MPLPTFLVIGAAESGTSALYAYLGQHPEVYMPPKKEPSWFSFDGQQVNVTVPHGRVAPAGQGIITEQSSYEALFSHAAAGQAGGGVSPAYLYWPRTAQRVAAEVSDMRIVAVLRHPVDRACSAFMHATPDGRAASLFMISGTPLTPSRLASGPTAVFMWRYRARADTLRNSVAGRESSPPSNAPDDL